MGEKLLNYHKPNLVKIPNLVLGKDNIITESEIVLQQMTKLQITNPVILKDCENVFVFPFRLTLKLIKALGYLDREEIGVIGRIHPSYKKDEIYLAELSMTKLYNKQIKPLKFKEANKYPEMVKDIAFIVDNNIESELLRNQIKRSGGKLLDNCQEFDVYNNIEEGKND